MARAYENPGLIGRDMKDRRTVRVRSNRNQRWSKKRVTLVSMAVAVGAFGCYLLTGFR